MGNSLLFGLPEYQINRLQKIQNHAARLVTKTPGNMHIIPVLKHLHWLPIRQRIEYKPLLHVYRTLSGQGPSYMSDLVQQYIQPDLCVQLLSYSLWFQGPTPHLGTEPSLVLRLDSGTACPSVVDDCLLFKFSNGI